MSLTGEDNRVYKTGQLRAETCSNRSIARRVFKSRVDTRELAVSTRLAILSKLDTILAIPNLVSLYPFELLPSLFALFLTVCNSKFSRYNLNFGVSQVLFQLFSLSPVSEAFLHIPL